LIITILNEKLSQQNIEQDKLVKLIRNRSQNVPSYIISLLNANLSYVNLSGINLSGTNLSGSDFFNTILFNTNLSETNLSYTTLAGADLKRSDLSYSNLSFADFSSILNKLDNHKFISPSKASSIFSPPDLSYANLTGAILASPNLSGIKLISTNLSYAIIINPINYDKLEMNENTNFKNSFTDDSEFIEFLYKRGSNSIPIKIENKNKLKEILIERKLDLATIKKIIESSKLEY
jgi:uncharacterized protein YjbI with pentapeptide repeats